MHHGEGCYICAAPPRSRMARAVSVAVGAPASMVDRTGLCSLFLVLSVLFLAEELAS